MYPYVWQAAAPYYYVAYPMSFPCDSRIFGRSSKGCISQAESDLRNEFRMLWEEHVAWTRMLIISIASDLKDEALVTQRLLRNAPDMAAVFRRYYGDQVASRFNDLMTQHLVIADQLVKAAKAGDTAATADAEKRWYANADEIAVFLSGINPYWPKNDVAKMMHEHLRLTKSEAVNRLNQNFAADISDYDKIEQQALMMADVFTDGIVKQFPNQFQ
ncbi:LysM peptidoglycan-binding domain-containing protein [Cohnella faecalis]|uniref:LysM peptidoglycan-binding domain-containing protein n=1 Tax=Cohnella faecalis TaxID=2315694 RepID=UPI001F479F13|nr:LysM peptidoglycan-binding domain-containing protein [Cohnella faecalis]